MRPAAVVIVAIVLAVCNLAPRSAQGKGFGMIVTGGDLGDVACPFSITTDDENSLTEENPTAAPNPLPPLS